MEWTLYRRFLSCDIFILLFESDHVGGPMLSQIKK